MSTVPDPASAHNTAPLRFIPIKTVVEQMGMQKTYLYDCIRLGTFVPPVKLGHRASRFLATEVDVLQRVIARGASADDLRLTVQTLIAAR